MYAETCDKNGEMYKKTTLTTYRQGIQRHLDAMRDDKIDIVKGSEFSTSAKIFGGVVKQMKREGKAAVDHHQFISDADLEALYAYLGSLHANDSVTGDGEGTLYAYKVKDELTKNHKTDDAKSEGRMYEIKERPRCPVRSLVAYIKKLNPRFSSSLGRTREMKYITTMLH